MIAASNLIPKKSDRRLIPYKKRSLLFPSLPNDRPSKLEKVIADQYISNH
jgi:hypothetical protein